MADGPDPCPSLQPGICGPASHITGGATECRVSSNKNIAVSGGVLRLTVRKESKPVSCAHPGGSYTTRYTGGNVTSQGKFAQAYGRFEVRAAFPAATVKGLHSAIWLWPRYFAYAEHSGEIDIAEWYSALPRRVYPSVHYVDGLRNVHTGHDGVIGYAFGDADWARRAEPAEVVGAVERLSQAAETAG